MPDEPARPADASPGAPDLLLPDRYRLIRELGRGGMAVVYLAEDLKHQRRVAIKVLRPELAAVLGAERFLAEIRTTASLQHPHILPLYDSGRTGSGNRPPESLFYVMPFVEGESLRDRLTREKQLPLATSVGITGEIASALDYAHRHGVVHRDVKPENILLHDGAAMIADFGIALAVSQAGGERLTETGVSVGTPQYMSPEQAAGESSLGPESDTYSLGCVCYEMLAGEPPFTGPTAQAIHAKRFREPPPRVGTVRDVPRGVDELLARAMARNPADRPASAAAFATALAAAATSSMATVPAPVMSPRTYRWPATVLAPLVAILAYGAWHLTRVERSPGLGVVRPVTFEQGLEIEPSLSPDGKYVAYVGGSPFRIYLRQPGSRPIQLITPDTGAPQRRPRWSPDGSRILFDSDQRLFIIPALGGVPRLVAVRGWSPTWSPDGTRAAYVLADTIFTIAVEGGSPSRLAITKEPAELAWSPDGRWIALTSGNAGWDGPFTYGNIAQTRILLIEARGGGIRELTDRSAMNVSPVWAGDSRRLFFVSNRGGGRDVYSVRIDRAGRPTSPPARLSTGLDAHTIGVSTGGDRLVYGAYHARVNIWTLPIPRSGSVGLAGATALTSGNQAIEGIAVSRDARWLYFTSDRTGNSDIYRLPLPGGEPEQLTSDPADDFAPQPSPDGAWLAFYTLRAGTRDIWLMPTGPGEAVRLTDDPGEEYFPQWSPDGRSLCYGQQNADSGNGTRLLQRNGDKWGPPILLPWSQLETSTGSPGCLGWSPDARHLLVPTEGGVARIQVDGREPRMIYAADPSRGRPIPGATILSPDGNTIYFRTAEGFWGLPATGGTPRLLVRFDDPARQSTRPEWATDGSRFYFSLGDPQSDVFVAEVSGMH